ncbi:hypothetical protein MTR67_001989 [Solanum verrucosum]|uniref:Uncharacterized protein n=1 Tax=Solanum verrucosum TaxID=315347 RepID=A0AAF0T8C1_SOLVR|nr:hypothetical protein MTR67_001989 [Solanum verrucosum]
MDMSCFLKEVGLDHDDVPLHLRASPHALELSMKSKSSTYQPESPTKHYVQVEELPELIFYDQVRCISFSPCAASPKSVKPRYISWPDDGVLDFALLWNTYPFKALVDTTFNSRITRSPLKYIRCSHCSVGGEDIKFSVMVTFSSGYRREETVQVLECRYLLQEASGQFCFHATHFYGLKEHVLATCLIDALSMSGDFDDAHHLLNWRKGGPETASNSGNFSLVATEVFLGQESSMKCNPAEATNLRGQLDLPYKLPRPVAVIAFCGPRSLNAAITENFPSPFAPQLSWSSVSLLIIML